MGIIGSYGPKTPRDVIVAGRWGIDWRPDLEGAETITSAAVSVYDNADGSDATAVMCPSGIAAVSGLYTTQLLASGVAGHTYTVYHNVVTSEGNKWEEGFEVSVITGCPAPAVQVQIQV